MIYITTAGCCRTPDLGYGAKKPKPCKHNSFYITLAAYEKQHGSVGVGAGKGTSPQHASTASSTGRSSGFDPQGADPSAARGLQKLHPAPARESDLDARRPDQARGKEGSAHVKRDASSHPSDPRGGDASGSADANEAQASGTIRVTGAGSGKSGVGPAKRRKGLRRGRGFDASKAQREKVRDLACVFCGRDDGVVIDPAHLWPRGKGGCDSADCVIPLCREHHRAFDDHQLELLPYLVRKGYHAEMAHAIGAHGVSPGELIGRCTGPEAERSAA